ncbi:hypothetical protein VTK26DRAFT_1177 [Humicola hyalothermophila]
MDIKKPRASAALCLYLFTDTGCYRGWVRPLHPTDRGVLEVSWNSASKQCITCILLHQYPISNLSWLSLHFVMEGHKGTLKYLSFHLFLSSYPSRLTVSGILVTAYQKKGTARHIPKAAPGATWNYKQHDALTTHHLHLSHHTRCPHIQGGPFVAPQQGPGAVVLQVHVIGSEMARAQGKENGVHPSVTSEIRPSCAHCPK